MAFISIDKDIEGRNVNIIVWFYHTVTWKNLKFVQYIYIRSVSIDNINSNSIVHQNCK